jgi:hypothetical protein
VIYFGDERFGISRAAFSGSTHSSTFSFNTNPKMNEFVFGQMSHEVLPYDCFEMDVNNNTHIFKDFFTEMYI